MRECTKEDERRQGREESIEIEGRESKTESDKDRRWRKGTGREQGDRET